MRGPSRAGRVGALAAVGLALASGCADVGWLLQQGVGQAEVLAGAQPIAPLLHDDDTPPEVRRRLMLVTAARNFAKRRLGLNVQQQYKSVTFLDAPAIVYVVSAAPRTSLEALSWEYPVVGRLPYRGHFSIDDAEAMAQGLHAQGYDVDVRPVTTYSLLGILPDPVPSPMLFRGDELDLVETIIHELAHATVFAAGQGSFNEGLATFIGREGRRLFVEEHYGPGSAIALRMRENDRDGEAYERAVAALAFDLRVLFAQHKTLSTAELLERKDRLFLRHQTHFRSEVAPTLLSYRLRSARLPDNNAALSAMGIYTLKQRVYEAAYKSCADDMRCLVRLLREVEDAADPELALAERVLARPAEVTLP